MLKVEEVVEALKSYRCKHWREDVDSLNGARLVEVLSTGAHPDSGKDEIKQLAIHLVKELGYGS